MTSADRVMSPYGILFLLLFLGCLLPVMPIMVYEGIRNGPILPPPLTTRMPVIYPTSAPAPVWEEPETNSIYRPPKYEYRIRLKSASTFKSNKNYISPPTYINQLLQVELRRY